MSAAQDEIVAEMSDLEDWLAKYEYLVARGRELNVEDEEIRTEEHAISGCQSSVWIRAELRGGRVHLCADSDAMITRGIIALLLRVLDGRHPREVARAELYFLDRTGLRTHLSPARANGLAAMVQRIRTCAKAWA
ncbi:MAG: SufE family protein [Gemmatimonadetes bacterium]|nr:SufE family protein [Gemmatimonadota bacterium]